MGYSQHQNYPSSLNAQNINFSSVSTLERFHALKAFLTANSFTNIKDEVYFYPGLLLLTIMEARSMYSLQKTKAPPNQKKPRRKAVYSLKERREDEFIRESWVYSLRSGMFIHKENEHRFEEVDIKKMFIKFVEMQAGNQPWIEKNCVREKQLSHENLWSKKLMRKHFSGLKQQDPAY